MLHSESPELGLKLFGMGIAALYGVAFAAVMGELLLHGLFNLSALVSDGRLLLTGIL
jgi:hypothetical protein